MNEIFDPTAAPTCPECGFLVYNRRYPKCESCGVELPDSIVYSAVERNSLRIAEEERAIERALGERHSDAVFPLSIDDSLMAAVISATER